MRLFMFTPTQLKNTLKEKPSITQGSFSNKNNLIGFLRVLIDIEMDQRKKSKINNSEKLQTIK